MRLFQRTPLPVPADDLALLNAAHPVDSSLVSDPHLELWRNRGLAVGWLRADNRVAGDLGLSDFAARCRVAGSFVVAGGRGRCGRAGLVALAAGAASSLARSSPACGGLVAKVTARSARHNAGRVWPECFYRHL